jgi:DNA-directed RNA polymerase specialized sigma24 family protein
MPNVPREEVLIRLCILSSEVGETVYHDEIAHNCFCGAFRNSAGFQFDEEVLRFIESAVRQAIIDKHRNGARGKGSSAPVVLESNYAQ